MWVIRLRSGLSPSSPFARDFSSRRLAVQKRTHWYRSGVRARRIDVWTMPLDSPPISGFVVRNRKSQDRAWQHPHADIESIMLLRLWPVVLAKLVFVWSQATADIHVN